jgi:hypothetical protein
VGLGDPRPTPTQARSSEPLDEGIPTAPQNFPATRPDQHTRRIKRPAAARVFIFSLFFSKLSVLVESSSASCNILPETVTLRDEFAGSRFLKLKEKKKENKEKEEENKKKTRKKKKRKEKKEEK